MLVKHSFLFLLSLILGGCAIAPTPSQVIPPPVKAEAILQAVDWALLPGWSEHDALGAWQAFLTSCSTLKKQNPWQETCRAAASVTPQNDAEARSFFQRWLQPHRLSSSDGKDSGLITGYYEPLLFGSRQPTARYRYPLYGEPADLLTIDLSSVYPELKSMRLRGRLEGNKVVPYFNRAEIENGRAPLQGRELVWVDDVVDLFFLQIQGSGRVQLENGDIIRIGYANQNGHPYASIGKKLVEQGELKLEQASMQGIKQWGERNPDKLNNLLNHNASYVFFKELPPSPPGQTGPPGALGVPLTAGRSLAVDPRAIPLGTPVFLTTTYPNSERPLQRLMLAQDTGGAIKGVVRGDFFWGFGDEAGKLAGSMRQQGQMWLLLPK